MKGLVLSGGKGTRLRPLTHTRAKQLIPIANKPNLFYAIEDLVAANVRDIGIIINPETGDEVRAALGDGSQWEAAFTFITQEMPLGLAHAVRVAQPFLGDDPFVMYLGDNLLSGGIISMVDEFARGQCDCIVLLAPVEDPRQFGVAVLDESGSVTRLVEKPEHPPSNLALVGIYAFRPQIHEVIAELTPSWRGEYEITDAIQGLVTHGYHVVAHQVTGWWKDTGKPEDLLDANRLILSQIRRDIRGTIEESEIIGDVIIEKGASVVRSCVRGPAHIACGARIEDAYVGPYSSIGPDVSVRNSECEYSIIMSESSISALPYRLDACIIGQGVRVEGGMPGRRRHTVQLVLGDRSHVIL